MADYNHRELEAPLEATLRLYDFRQSSRRRVKGNAVTNNFRRNGYSLKYSIRAKTAEKHRYLAVHAISDLEVEITLKLLGGKERKIYAARVVSNMDAVAIMRKWCNEFGSELSLLL